ncbi:MAG TPA: M56 family metallopeptidase, partial [Gemmatimonadales bacterium]|nr:M56 family metallopeptidase [Gemmatimonadales bacterium]
MIAAWMLYCVGIGLAFVIVGHAMERALHFAGRPTRWAWAAALAGSFVVPAAAWLLPDSFRAVSVPAPEPIAYQPVANVGAPIVGEPAVAAPMARSALAPSDLDRPLAWTWGLASAALLAALTIAALRLAVLRRRWRATVVHGRRVLVSDDVGPAVTGVWVPRIVIPGWALSLAERQRELMLAHEEEHVRAGDPRLLAAGIVALLLAPWNPALWWHMRRLRLAVEMDCDARVLARGGAAPEYGELLLHVGGRRGHLLGAPALGEPRSFLEHRIRRM